MTTPAEPPSRSPAGSANSGRSLREDDGRLVRGRKSRERIRTAARELFREKGFDGATLRAIARRAGMGASSIYRHVQTKEELLVDELDAIQERAWSRFRLEDDRSRPTRQRVHHFLDVQHEGPPRDTRIRACRRAQRDHRQVPVCDQQVVLDVEKVMHALAGRP